MQDSEELRENNHSPEWRSEQLTDTERANIELDELFYGKRSQKTDADMLNNIDNAAVRNRNQS